MNTLAKILLSFFFLFSIASFSEENPFSNPQSSDQPSEASPPSNSAKAPSLTCIITINCVEKNKKGIAQNAFGNPVDLDGFYAKNKGCIYDNNSEKNKTAWQDFQNQCNNICKNKGLNNSCGPSKNIS